MSVHSKKKLIKDLFFDKSEFFILFYFLEYGNVRSFAFAILGGCNEKFLGNLTEIKDFKVNKLSRFKCSDSSLKSRAALCLEDLFLLVVLLRFVVFGGFGDLLLLQLRLIAVVTGVDLVV